MWKYFYKTILVSVLCGSMLMLDFAYKGNSLGVQINSARAETVSTGGGEDSNLMATLTMVGISIMASRLFLYGKITPDIAVAAAGGLAFVAGDMMATKELKNAKDKIETEIKRKKNGDLTDEQRQYLLRLITMYRASKDAAETKKNLQLAAAAAFAAAAIIAYMMSASEIAAMTACQTAIAPVVAASNAETVVVCAASYGTGCGVAEADNAKCQASLVSLSTTLGAYIGGRTPPEPSCAAMPAVNALRGTSGGVAKATPGTCILANVSGTPALLVTACEAMFGLHLGYESGCMAPPVLYATTAVAVLAMGITAPTIITAIVGLSATLATTIDTAIFIPTRRAIVWGVLAGLSYAASSATESVISEINGNITKLENLVNTINVQAVGQNGQSSSLSNKPVALGPINNRSNALSKPEETATELNGRGERLPCITNPNSTDGKGCDKFSSQMNALPALSDAPSAVTDSMANLNKMSDGLNGANKVTNGTLSAARNLAQNATSLMNAMKKAKSDAQMRLLAAGSSKNLDKDEKDLKDQMVKAFTDTMKKNNTNYGALMAAYGSGGGFGDLSKSVNEDLKKNAKKLNLPTFTLPTFTPATGIKANGVNNNSASDLDADAAAAAAKAAAEAEKNKAASIDEYDMKNNDINLDKGENIFNVISNRYQKSGYPRLFKRLNE